jgi:DNA-binding MarR family transcriptional regulator
MTTWWLAEHEGAPTQARVAAHAGTDAMMTSQVVRRLEGRGLLHREADAADSRVRRLTPTDAGQTLLSGALADVEAADAEHFRPLGSRTPAFLADLATLDSGV